VHALRALVVAALLGGDGGPELAGFRIHGHLDALHVDDRGIAEVVGRVRLDLAGPDALGVGEVGHHLLADHVGGHLEQRVARYGRGRVALARSERERGGRGQCEGPEPRSHDRS
jgi:hypothetical protein